MKPNLNFYDLITRYGLVFLFGIIFGATQLWVFLILAVLLFITAVTGWCPIFKIMGIDHEKHQHSD